MLARNNWGSPQRPKKDIHEGARRTTKGHQGVGEDSRGIRQRSGRGKGFPPRGLKYLLRGQKINPPRDSKGLRKTRQGSVKGHEERHEGEKEIHQGSGSTRRSRLTSRISVDQYGAGYDRPWPRPRPGGPAPAPHRFSLRLPLGDSPPGGVIRICLGARASRPHPVPATASAPAGASGPGSKLGTWLTPCQGMRLCLGVYSCSFVVHLH